MLHAQVLCEPGGPLSQQEALRQALLAVTLNNVGVHRQRAGQAHLALQALRRAADLEAQLLLAKRQPPTADEAGTPPPDPQGGGPPGEQDETGGGGAAAVLDTPASTQLNLCTVLSGAGRHAEALACVDGALAQLCGSDPLHAEEREVVAWACAPRAFRPAPSGASPGRGDGGDQQPGDARASGDGEAGAPREEGLGTRLAQMPQTALSVLAMCLYNKAVQLEHLVRIRWWIRQPWHRPHHVHRTVALT